MTDGFPLLVLEGKDDGAKEKAAVGLTLGVAASIPVTPLSEPPAVAALLELLSTSSLSRSNKIDNTDYLHLSPAPAKSGTAPPCTMHSMTLPTICMMIP